MARVIKIEYHGDLHVTVITVKHRAGMHDMDVFQIASKRWRKLPCKQTHKANLSRQDYEYAPKGRRSALSRVAFGPSWDAAQHALDRY